MSEEIDLRANRARIEQAAREREAAKRADADEFLAQVLRRAQACVDEKADEVLAEAAAAPALTADRKRARMVRAGVNDLDAVDLFCRSTGAPFIPGHKGNRRAFEAVEKFLAAPTLRTLWLLGTPGAGKSYAAIWAIAQFDGDSLLVSQADMRMGATWDSRFDRAKTVPLLVIDDPTERLLDWQATDVGTLLSDRHNQRRRTIVPANIYALAKHSETAGPRGSVEGLFGPRVLSRMQDTQYSAVAYIDGDDIRSTR